MRQHKTAPDLRMRGLGAQCASRGPGPELLVEPWQRWRSHRGLDRPALGGHNCDHVDCAVEGCA